MKKRTALALGVGLAMILLLAAGACRKIGDNEEEQAFYHFILDTPPDGATDVNPMVLLHWSISCNIDWGGDSDLYLGVTPLPPFLKRITWGESGYHRPGPLQPNQTYYWRLYVPSPPGSSKVQSFTVGRDRTVWSFQLAPGHSVYDVPGAPFVQGNCVFQNNEGGILQCLDASSGALLWTFQADQPRIQAGKPTAGVERFYQTYRNIYCLNAADGSLLWSAAPANPNLGFHGPLPLGDRIFTYTNERFSCLDPQTGVEVWGSDRSTCTSLLAETGRLFATTRDAGGANFLECLDPETGSLLWNRNFGSQSSPSGVAATASRVFIGHEKILYCLDARNGAPIWEYQAAEFAATPFIINGNVFLATGQDRYTLLNAVDGTELWQCGQLERTDYQHYTRWDGKPVLVNGSILQADNSGFLYAIDAATGEIRWHYFVSTDIGIACFGNLVYVTGDDEYLYCLDTEQP
jgi:outer membrane protein assembly factor BamB